MHTLTVKVFLKKYFKEGHLTHVGHLANKEHQGFRNNNICSSFN